MSDRARGWSGWVLALTLLGLPLVVPAFACNAADARPASAESEPAIAIAVVDAIPHTYAAQLADFVGQQILAEVQLFGTTLGGVHVTLRPFVYPIEICDRCLARCVSGLQRQGLAPEDLAGDQCADNTGSDGRVCIDNGC